MLNVNIPAVPYEDINGISLTRLGTRHSDEPCIKDTDPRGETIYWIGPPGSERDAGEGTDFFAIRNNRVSVTPIGVDLTSHKSFDYVDNLLKSVSLD